MDFVFRGCEVPVRGRGDDSRSELCRSPDLSSNDQWSHHDLGSSLERREQKEEACKLIRTSAGTQAPERDRLAMAFSAVASRCQATSPQRKYRPPQRRRIWRFCGGPCISWLQGRLRSTLLRRSIRGSELKDGS